MGLVAPFRYGIDWAPTPIEPELPHWRSRLLNRNSIPLHLWDPRALRRAVREFEPDLIDIHEEPYFPAAAEAVAAAAGRPVVMQTCQNIRKDLPVPIRASRSWVFGRVRAFYPCSTEAAGVLRTWGYPGAVQVIPYGVEDELFDVKPSGERVGFVGRLTAEKGVRDLYGFGSRLLCVGSGPLAAEARAAGAEVTVARSTEELARQLGRMGVLAMPSRTTPGWKEQFGRTAAEAMAAGVPVVAYDSGSLPEVVGGAGRLVREGDVRRLRETLDAVLADPDGLGESGRTRARKLFRWETVAARMIELYRAALAA